MKNDYLWDKKGNDAEIERLENALQTFRYQPSAPPIIPPKVLQIEEKPKFNFSVNIFRFAFAGGVCLAVLTISLSIWWLSFSANKIKDIGEINSSLVKPTIVDSENQLQSKSDSPDITKEVESKPVKTRVSKSPRTIKASARPQIQKAKIDKVKQLTEEEKDAYNQLILALSITGSQIKEVNAKANDIIKTTIAIK